MKRSVAAAVLVVIALVMAQPLFAGSPVETILETIVEPALTNIQSTLSSMTTTLTSISSALSAAQSTLSGVDTKVGRTTRYVALARTFTTVENANNVMNLDVQAGLPFGHVNRYTVTMQLGGLGSAAPGVDSLRLIGQIMNDSGTSAIDGNIVAVDPSGTTMIVQQPYAAGRSFISVIRGADGLGPVVITVNAVIETNQ